MKNILPFMIILIAVSSCISISPEERKKEESNYEIQKCTEIGFKPDTVEFRNCRLQILGMNEQKKAALGAAIIGANSHPYHQTTCNTFGTSTTCY